MKTDSKIILTAAFAFLLSIDITLAQENSAANNAETFIIRNRLDSGYTWTASADALFMTRVGGKSATLIQDAGSEALLNSQDVYFPWVAGPRVGIVGEDVLFGCDLEASFFDLDFLFNKGMTIPDGGGSYLVFNEPTFALDSGDAVNYRYLSQLRSTEINLRHPLWERFSVLMGFRYIDLHEDLSSTVNDLLYVDSNVDNHLYGGQIGMNVAIVNTCRFSIEGVMKAGVYGNHSDLEMRVRDLYNHLGTKTSHTAFTAEIGLMGIVQVTNHLALRGGYQAMWLDGVATAIDQLENVNPIDSEKPYMGGTLFYHGAIAGLEYAF